MSFCFEVFKHQHLSIRRPIKLCHFGGYSYQNELARDAAMIYGYIKTSFGTACAPQNVLEISNGHICLADSRTFSI